MKTKEYIHGYTIECTTVYFTWEDKKKRFIGS